MFADLAKGIWVQESVGAVSRDPEALRRLAYIALGLLKRTDEIGALPAGRIIDIQTGKGIAGVKLTAVLRAPSASQIRYVCTSREDGAFSFNGLQSGEYQLQGNFLSLDVILASGQNIHDVLIGIDGPDALQYYRVQ